MGLFSKNNDRLQRLEQEQRSQQERVSNLLGQLAALEKDIDSRLRDLEGRIGEEVRALRGLGEYLESRVEDGNKQWRRIRARERAQAFDEDSEGESESHPDLFPGNANGGGEEGMPSMHEDLDMDGRPLAPWQKAARAIARHYAGRG